MRLYVKLALIVLAACGGQALLSSTIAGETYFALRCLAATAAGDQAAEAKLVRECETKLIATRDREITVVAVNTTPSW